METNRWIRALTRTRECPLSCNAWLVYSLLLSYKKPVKLDTARIERDLGLSRQGIYSVRDKLTELGLLDADLMPRPAPDEWFSKRGDGLAYFKLYLPSEECPSSVSEIAAYCFMKSMKKTVGPAAITTVLGVSKPTAIKIIQELRDMELIDMKKVLADLPNEWLRPKVKNVPWTSLPPKERAKKTLLHLRKQFDVSVLRELYEGDKRHAEAWMFMVAQESYAVNLSRHFVLGFLGMALQHGTRHRLWKPIHVIASKVLDLVRAYAYQITGDDFPLLTEAKQKFRKITAYKALSQSLGRLQYSVNVKSKQYIGEDWHNCGV